MTTPQREGSGFFTRLWGGWGVPQYDLWAFALEIPPHYSRDDGDAFDYFQRRVSSLRRRMSESTALEEAGQAKPGADNSGTSE